ATRRYGHSAGHAFRVVGQPTAHSVSLDTNGAGVSRPVARLAGLDLRDRPRGRHVTAVRRCASVPGIARGSDGGVERTRSRYGSRTAYWLGGRSCRRTGGALGGTR